MTTNYSFLLTCEHASAEIPHEFQFLFEQHQDVLQTHRGLDIGAVAILNAFERKYHVPVIQGKYSRLLIELNRSPHHSHLFSDITKVLDEKTKKYIIDTYYKPYRQMVLDQIDILVKQNLPVLHLSVHTYTPELHGHIRNNDVGLLYDPNHGFGKKYCHAWARRIKKYIPDCVVRMNYPYRGTNDSFMCLLRKYYSHEHYLGIELEVNQKYFQDDNFMSKQKKLISVLINTIFAIK